MATRKNGAAAPVPTQDAGIRFSMSWGEEGKTRRMSGLSASDLAAALKVEPSTLQAAIGELITQPQAGAGRGPRTEEQRERERAYREKRKASMTDEQRAAEKAKRQEYNKRKNAEIKEAMRLYREQNGK